jgi:hypothetical protein
VRSPVAIPGVTLVRREHGATPEGEPGREVPDLYLGVDCSGSMVNPAMMLSWPVTAGTVVCLSALRARAAVKVTLSGEPGKHCSTDGFVRNERQILGTLTSYLGTGYAFGIERLRDTFLGETAVARPTHILIVTDADLFMMIGSVADGWALMESAVKAAGGGATAVHDQAELVAFARAFSRRRFSREVT